MGGPFDNQFGPLTNPLVGPNPLEGWSPLGPTGPRDKSLALSAADISTMIQEKFPQMTLTLEQKYNLYNAIQGALDAGDTGPQIVKNMTNVSSVVQAIRDGKKEEDVAVTGRLKFGGEDTPKPGDIEGITTSADGQVRKLPNGNILIGNNLFDAQGNRVATAPQGRSSSEVAADQASAASSYASANASNANAESIRTRTQLLLQNAERAGTSGGLPAGFIWDAEGKPVRDNSMNDMEKATIRQRADEALQAHLDRVEANGIDRVANDIRREEVMGTQEYQRGQLDISRGQLAQGDKQIAQGERRLGLDTWVAQQSADAKRAENALKRDEYVGKILSNPADFIARAFMSRGEASPSKPITQADLINATNQNFNANPNSYAAPQSTPPPGIPQMAYGSTGNGGNGFVNDKTAIVGDPQANGLPNPEIIHNPTGAPISVTPMQGNGNGRLSPQGSQSSPNAQQQEVEDPEVVNTKKAVESISKLLQYVQDPQTQHRLVDEIAEQRGKVKAYAYGTEQGTMPSAGGAITGEMKWGSQEYSNPLVQVPSPIDPRTKDPYPTNYSTSQLPFERKGPIVPPSGPGNGMVTNPWGWEPQLGFNPARRTQAMPTNIGPGTIEHLNWLKSSDPVNTLTQDEIVSRAEANLPPALRQLFGGRLEKPFDTVNGRSDNPQNNTGIAPLRLGFNAFSPQDLEQLTPDEQVALNSYLAAKYNTSLNEVLAAMKQLYVAPRSTVGRGRLSV